MSSLEVALSLLQSPREKDRLAGAKELVATAGTRALEPQVRAAAAKLLFHEEAQLRAAGVKALSLAGGSELLGQFERAARDDDAAVRREATRALGALEDRAALPALARLLQDEDAQVRFDAAAGLAALDDRSGVPVLLEGVEDKFRRFFALGALARLGEPSAREPAERILRKRLFVSDFERAQAAGLLTRLGVAEGRAYLLDRIRRRRADDRGLCMELCGEHKLRDAIPALRAAMADARELFRGTAARALGLLGDTESTDAMVALAHDTRAELEVRFDAMEGLMFLRTAEALAALHALSSGGESEEIREGANDALGWLQAHPETRA